MSFIGLQFYWIYSLTFYSFILWFIFIWILPFEHISLLIIICMCLLFIIQFELSLIYFLSFCKFKLPRSFYSFNFQSLNSLKFLFQAIVYSKKSFALNDQARFSWFWTTNRLCLTLRSSQIAWFNAQADFAWFNDQVKFDWFGLYFWIF